MPELPEVEIMTRNARRWLSGQTLAALEVLDDALLPAASAAAVAGAHIGEARRRGKYLCLPLGTQTLILHFRMTGKVVLETEPRRHVRARIHTDAHTVAFVDTRRLGCAWLLPTSEVSAFFDAIPLGPEPWPMPRDGAWWAARLSGTRSAIKPALLRQDRIAGLGNIAVVEILHRAKLHPARTVPSLTASDFAAIAAAAPVFIAHVLAVESGPEIHYVNEGAAIPTPFLVYGRAGLACTCGSTIERTVQSGRATFSCPNCQRR
ncbi:MAG: DNA-formamidopyrimidine glycosylase family protein [Myxococcota bacterium]|nr:DNA-formamidopyrimidine glycosylase family protein [Myxococcota bacterium]